MTPARRLLTGLGVLGAAALGALAIAQIEGSDRGVPPIDSSASYEVEDVAVDVSGRTADQARSYGWRLAQRRAWRRLWARVRQSSADEAPNLPDGTLDGMVSAIEVEDEQIGPTRYVARLGVLFDRGRADALLGVHGNGPRSQPMLVIPVMWSGGAGQSFEKRTEWQRAWARFRTGNSAIDYVRPAGTGTDPLLLNAAQADRTGRGWWRALFARYGASDVLVPIVQVERRWPGGPALLRFRALHGPQGEEVARFDLVAADPSQLPAVMDEAVRRMDAAFTAALRAGGLIPDQALEEPPPLTAADLADEPAVEQDAPVVESPLPEAPPVAQVPVQQLSVEVETPDAGAEQQAEAALRRVPGVTAVDAASLALGGVSVLRVSFAGDAAALRAALPGSGLEAAEGGGALRLRLAGR